MNARKPLTIALAALSVAICPASASGYGFGYPGERPDTSPIRAQLRDLAVTYWAARGITGCPAGIAVDAADDLGDPSPGTHVEGRGADCRIVLAPTHDLHRMRAGSSWWYPVVTQQCRLVVHEVGHALGLEHTTHGVMAPSTTYVPQECRAFAAPTMRAHRAKALTGHPRQLWGRHKQSYRALTL